MYGDGRYSSKNPGWHECDAPWKAAQVLSMLDDRNFRPESIVDIGCGTGGVLDVIAGALHGTRLVGYDPSSQAIEMFERSDRVELRAGTPKDVHEHYNLLLCLDVFEHVEDYIGFLRSLLPVADWFIFHIPLDVSAQSVIREGPLLSARSNLGHLHYFTRRTALASLETAGFEIACEKLLFPNDMPNRRPKTRIANIPRGLGRHLRPQLSARILGGSTLLVLASAQHSGSFPGRPRVSLVTNLLATWRMRFAISHQRIEDRRGLPITIHPIGQVMTGPA
jgi:SAM-dependent methyltransferase